MTTLQTPSFLLCDNGSLRPEPTLRLRRIAGILAARLKHPVAATSLLHSDRVDPSALDGRAALLLETELQRQLAEGHTHFVVLPFFIGPSGALTDTLPQRLDALGKPYPSARVVIADSLARLEPEADLRLADILRDRVIGGMRADLGSGSPQVIVVDHGSPVRQVALLRDRIADRLAQRLGSVVHSVRAASMERPEGDAYAFNDPLLEQALADRPTGPVVVCQLFLAPGRHAGPDGDIAAICRVAETATPGLRIVITDPIGPHPTIIDILADRAREAMGRFQAGA